MSREYLQQRIDATKAQILAVEQAVLGLETNAIQSYTLDTGQTRQTVTKADIGMVNGLIDKLYNRLATLEARLTGNGVVQIRPAF